MMSDVLSKWMSLNSGWNSACLVSDDELGKSGDILRMNGRKSNARN